MTQWLNTNLTGTKNIFTNIRFHCIPTNGKLRLFASNLHMILQPTGNRDTLFKWLCKYHINIVRWCNKKAAVTGLNLTFQHLHQASSNQEILQDSPEYCKPVPPLLTLRPSLYYCLHSAPLLGLKVKRHTVRTEPWYTGQNCIYRLLNMREVAASITQIKRLASLSSYNSMFPHTKVNIQLCNLKYHRHSKGVFCN